MTKIKILLATAALIAVPGFAMAECSWGSGHEVTMSCGEGTSWDGESQSCVPTSMS